MPDLEFERIELNAIPTGDMPVFHASQYETMRPFIADLKWGDAEFAPGEGCWCTLTIRKTDDTLIIIDPMDIDSSEVSCILPQQAVACVGDNFCQLKVWSTEDDVDGCIACLNFILHVQPDPEAGGLTSESEIQNLETQIAEIVPEVIGNDYYNKTETDALLATKADTSDLPDMTQYYTKSATDTLLNNKADKSDTYTKAQVDSALALKANQATTYTKTETNTLLDAKVSKFQLDSDIPVGDVWAAQVEQAFDSDIGYFDKVSNRALNVYTKAQVDAIIAGLFPTKSATGAIANFSTALALPLVSCTVDAGATTIKACGANLWDEDWELGTLDGNGNWVSGNYVGPKNAQRIIGGETYYLASPSALAAWFYSSDGTPIESVTLINNRTFTPPSNACFLRFRTYQAYGTTYNNDISINYPSTDTSYHAYNGTTYPIADKDNIVTLRGVNNIFTDSGDTTVQYKDTTV